MQDTAPDGWYQDLSQLYKKALNWGYNKQAAVLIKSDQQRSSSHRPENAEQSRRSNKRDRFAGKRTAQPSQEPDAVAPPAKKGKQGGAKYSGKPAAGGRPAGATTEEFAARVAAGKCGACGVSCLQNQWG